MAAKLSSPNASSGGLGSSEFLNEQDVVFLSEAGKKADAVDRHSGAKIYDHGVFPAFAGDPGDDSAAAEDALAWGEAAEVGRGEIAVELLLHSADLIIAG